MYDADAWLTCEKYNYFMLDLEWAHSFMRFLSNAVLITYRVDYFHFALRNHNNIILTHYNCIINCATAILAGTENYKNQYIHLVPQNLYQHKINYVIYSTGVNGC